MKTLLRIDASVRHTGSYSRTMGDYFVERWREIHPDGNVMWRDVSKDPIPHLSAELATAFFSGEKNLQQLKLSNELCQELIQCDDIVITCPMYNLGIPSTSKTWLDHIVRVNETFKYEHGKGYQGLLVHQKVYIINSMGGSKLSEASKSFENYLTAILAFIGITNVTILTIDETAKMQFNDSWQAPFITQINQQVMNNMNERSYV